MFYRKEDGSRRGEYVITTTEAEQIAAEICEAFGISLDDEDEQEQTEKEKQAA